MSLQTLSASVLSLRKGIDQTLYELEMQSDNFVLFISSQPKQMFGNILCDELLLPLSPRKNIDHDFCHVKSIST